MSREDFMRQLEMLLADVPQEEKQEALSYHRRCSPVPLGCRCPSGGDYP